MSRRKSPIPSWALSFSHPLSFFPFVSDVYKDPEKKGLLSSLNKQREQFWGVVQKLPQSQNWANYWRVCWTSEPTFCPCPAVTGKAQIKTKFHFYHHQNSSIFWANSRVSLHPTPLCVPLSLFLPLTLCPGSCRSWRGGLEVSSVGPPLYSSQNTFAVLFSCSTDFGASLWPLLALPKG